MSGTEQQTGLTKRELWLPFVLTVCIIVVDQITKVVIVRTIDLSTIGVSLWNGFLRIIHTRNLGIAFSIGNSLSPEIRRLLFIVVPVAVMVFVFVYYFKGSEVTASMRWALAGILGGGIGNIVDRIFRPLGVVDFLDFRFYGIFGLERWPTFNVADMSVVISGISLVVLFMVQERRNREQKA